MKKFFAILTILFSTLVSKGIMADVNADKLRAQTLATTTDKIGNGTATCMTTQMSKEEATDALEVIQNHMSDISPLDREIIREKIITILKEIEN